jgi:hypothetical protein
VATVLPCLTVHCLSLRKLTAQTVDLAELVAGASDDRF